jgi:hypothetical protein
MEAPEALHFSPAHSKLPRQLVPQVYYVEDAFEVSAKLAGFFSILLEGSRPSVEEAHNKTSDRYTGCKHGSNNPSRRKAHSP